jgi:hypothetical protein
MNNKITFKVIFAFVEDNTTIFLLSDTPYASTKSGNYQSCKTYTSSEIQYAMEGLNALFFSSQCMID